MFPHLSGQISFYLVNELNFEWNGEKIGGLILGWVQPRLRNKMHVNFPFLNPMLRDELVGLAKTPGKFITYSLILLRNHDGVRFPIFYRYEVESKTDDNHSISPLLVDGF